MRKVDPEQYEARREQIIAAAAACFRRDGYRGASMSAICSQAGMSPGHLYHYFKSKDEIVHAHVGCMLEETVQGIQDGFPSYDGPFVERLAEWVCDVFRRMQANPDRRAMVLEVTAEAVRNPKVATILHERVSDTVMAISAYLRKRQDSGEIDSSIEAKVLVMTLRSLVRGMLTPPMDDPRLFPEEERCRMIRQVVIALCAPKGADA